MTDGFGMVVLARLLVAKGDSTGALEIVEAFENRMRTDSMPAEFREDLHTLRIRVQLAGGDLRGAARRAEDVQRNPDYEELRGYYRLTLARIRLAQGRYGEVEELLDGAALLDAVGSQVARDVEAGLMLAAALAGQRRLPEALERLEACLALAAPDGHTRAFLDAGEPARDLLDAYLRAGDGDQLDYAREVLQSFPPAGVQPGGLVEPLSERELEVLQLIARGCTNKEVAQQLIIAPGTVKAHTAAIYRKLDVANRTEAVARAREVGVLG
jgi:LuxR family maltose regulon positive regulatory protein